MDRIGLRWYLPAFVVLLVLTAGFVAEFADRGLIRPAPPPGAIHIVGMGSD